MKSKAEYIKYLEARGYHSDLVLSSFAKAELQYRSASPQIKPKASKRIIPLVVDYNPGLPNCNTIIQKYKHILDLDTSVPFNSKDVVVSYRKAKTIKDLLVSSRLKARDNEAKTGRCGPCKKKCTLCKNFLVLSNKFTSHHTKQNFNILQNIDCDSDCVIYLINIKKCNVSYVGYTTTTMKIRWANTKSHIKKFIQFCEVSTHMIKCEAHKGIDRSSTAAYDRTLKEELEVFIIEQVRVPPCSTTEKKEQLCESREGHWQTMLRTLTRYGGLKGVVSTFI